MIARTFARRIAGASLVAAVLAGPLVVVQSASAAPVGPGLFLTVSGSNDTWIRGVDLDCESGRGGDHPNAEAACAALDRARGDLDALPGRPRPCTKEYDPVTATAVGEHRGRSVDWTRTYPNACVLWSATDPVFDF
ncbi:SSI family serine proteinase inhibitor [Nocardiopsis ansamitocini]|uniref:Subtilisin inhibitor domain-containing protein n=1 Tax=Nocardiopsis ansamitocini TaxID=1670832 RepID=A0A9W6P8W3_9ACTN|nr:SSI family serine proteinase inhibitor [Nocardiopsis ansamitocini]GLU49182.1 hypothetical protein Nans01_35330 [Nocardiopsis ansamitocini]